MSLPLVDERVKITRATDCVLETQRKMTGKPKSELMREVLHRWAEAEIRVLMFLRSEMEDNGILRDYEGGEGK